MASWVVSSDGGPNQDSFEIAVVRADYGLGLKSNGWFCGRKLLISHSGGFCRTPTTERIWRGLIELAEVVARELNDANVEHVEGLDERRQGRVLLRSRPPQ